MSAPVACISGTWGRRAGQSGSYTWWRPPSVFLANLRNAGLALVSETDYFDWSTGLDGMGAQHDVWETAGKALYWWWVAHGRPALSLIGHSHGPQVVAYALRYSWAVGDPMVLEHLVTVGTPVREDMQDIWNAAAPLLVDWTHLYTNEVICLPDDLGYQALGSLPPSAAFPFRRTMVQASRNIEVIPATTHHGLMWPDLWNTHDFWQYLK
jgi:hypothetical protein